jgi:L-fuculose-phosphate aldolase
MENSTQTLMRELVYAFHIIDLDGQGSGVSGHLTARIPGAETFWTIPFGHGFGEASLENLVESDFSLRTVTGIGKVNPTLHIHTEIYRARPDVNCILHTHSENALALGITGNNIEPITQSGALFYEDVVLFDEFGGIVLDVSEGQAIANQLGHRRAILLKHHGSIVVAKNIRECAILGIVLEFAARVQLKAMSAGELHRLPPELVLNAKSFLVKEDLMSLRWDLLVRDAIRKRPQLTSSAGNMAAGSRAVV